MKVPLIAHYCIMKTCDYSETNHKIRDGLKCPKCNGPVMSYIVKR